jgi:hypothetical protein
LTHQKILIVYSNLAQMAGAGWRAGDAACRMDLHTSFTAEGATYERWIRLRAACSRGSGNCRGWRCAADSFERF